jgi:hypothetical protein
VVVKRLNHPYANMFIKHLGRMFVAYDVFDKTKGLNRIEILSKRQKSINIKLIDGCLLVDTDKYSMQFSNAKRIIDESDLLEYLIA